MGCAVPACILIALAISGALVFNVPVGVVAHVALAMAGMSAAALLALRLHVWWTTPPATIKFKQEMRTIIRARGMAVRIHYFDHPKAPRLVVEAKNLQNRDRLAGDAALEEQLRAVLLANGYPPDLEFLFEVKGTDWLYAGRLPGE